MKYALSRIIILLVMMLAVSFLVFAAFAFIPGDVAVSMLGIEATPQSVAALRAELGLDKPLLVRYGSWLMNFVSGNMGISYSYKQPVQDMLADKIPLSFALGLTSFFLVIAVSIPFSLFAARFASKKFAMLSITVNQFMMAVPSFFIGIILSWVFGVILHAFTPGYFPKFSEDFWGAAKYIFFAAVAISLPRIAMSIRMFSFTLLKEMQKDYVRTAIVRGNNRHQVLLNHVLRNSLAPSITFFAQMLAEILAGGIIVEQVFGIPGLGRMLLASISTRDFPVVQAIVVLISFLVVLSNTIGDIVNSIVDPRLKLGGNL